MKSDVFKLTLTYLTQAEELQTKLEENILRHVLIIIPVDWSFHGR